MNKICLIGNSGIKHGYKDGQTTKVRLYVDKIRSEGFSLTFIDLENFTNRPFSTLFRIKKAIKECDRVVLLTAERGCRLLIPYINHLNKRYKKVFVLPLVGSSVLHYFIDSLSDDEKIQFILNENFGLVKKTNKHFAKQLKKIDFILPETEILSRVFSNYFKLNNVVTLTNFRDGGAIIKKREPALPIKIVFLSRVMEQKGVFDLMLSVSEINKKCPLLCLDIFGEKKLDEKNNLLFDSYLDSSMIQYLGPIDNDIVIETLSQYDLFAFPTRFVYEGTPGVIIESLIAGTPVLTSAFPQANILLKNGYDSVFFEMFNKEDLKRKLQYFVDNKQKLSAMSKNASISSKKYIYSFQRKNFLKYICGVEEEK